MIGRGQSSKKRILMTSAAILAAGSVAVMAQELQLPELQRLEGDEPVEAPEPGLRMTVDLNAGFTFDTNENLTDPSRRARQPARTSGPSSAS